MEWLNLIVKIGSMEVNNINENEQVMCKGNLYDNMDHATKSGMAKSDCRNWKYGSGYYYSKVNFK